MGFKVQWRRQTCPQTTKSRLDLDKEAQRECLSPAWEEVREGFLEEGTLKMHLEDKKVHSRMVKKENSL